MAAFPSSGSSAPALPERDAPEADATSDLYGRYGTQIRAFCFHRLRNREEAEDATQSTFLNAFRSFQRGVRPEYESAWLYKIAQNVCLTRQRSAWRRRQVEATTDLDAIQDIVPSRENAGDDLIELPAALKAMPEQQRKALLLREWQGLSYREIAEELALSQSAVEALLFRARRTLATSLTGDEPRKKRRRRDRTTANGSAGSLVAILKTLLLGGGAKVAATVTAVAATSMVAATPGVQSDLARFLSADWRVEHASRAAMMHASKPTPHAVVRKTANPASSGLPASPARTVAQVVPAPPGHVPSHSERATSPPVFRAVDQRQPGSGDHSSDEEAASAAVVPPQRGGEQTAGHSTATIALSIPAEHGDDHAASRSGDGERQSLRPVIAAAAPVTRIVISPASVASFWQEGEDGHGGGEGDRGLSSPSLGSEGGVGFDTASFGHGDR